MTSPSNDRPTDEATLKYSEAHIQEILDLFSPRLSRKYMKGVMEHGGRLGRKNVLPFMIEEIIDFVVYMHVLERQVERAKTLLKDYLEFKDPASAEKAYNILTVGNPEGITEEDH